MTLTGRWLHVMNVNVTGDVWVETCDFVTENVQTGVTDETAMTTDVTSMCEHVVTHHREVEMPISWTLLTLTGYVLTYNATSST